MWIGENKKAMTYLYKSSPFCFPERVKKVEEYILGRNTPQQHKEQFVKRSPHIMSVMEKGFILQSKSPRGKLWFGAVRIICYLEWINRLIRIYRLIPMRDLLLENEQISPISTTLRSHSMSVYRAHYDAIDDISSSMLLKEKNAFLIERRDWRYATISATSHIVYQIRVSTYLLW